MEILESNNIAHRDIYIFDKEMVEREVIQNFINELTLDQLKNIFNFSVYDPSKDTPKNEEERMFYRENEIKISKDILMKCSIVITDKSDPNSNFKKMQEAILYQSMMIEKGNPNNVFKTQLPQLPHFLYEENE